MPRLFFELHEISLVAFNNDSSIVFQLSSLNSIFLLNIRYHSYKIVGLYRLSPWSINIITTFINFLSILAYLIADLTTCQPNFKIQFRYFTNINSWPQYKMQHFIWLLFIWIVQTAQPWYNMEAQLWMANFEILVLNTILRKIFKQLNV